MGLKEIFFRRTCFIAWLLFKRAYRIGNNAFASMTIQVPTKRNKSFSDRFILN